MNEINKIWVVDDDKSIRWVLEKALTREGLQVVTFDEPKKLLQTGCDHFGYPYAEYGRHRTD
jgi:DNA-binding NtrC family response regulator